LYGIVVLAFAHVCFVSFGSNVVDVSILCWLFKLSLFPRFLTVQWWVLALWLSGPGSERHGFAVVDIIVFIIDLL